MLTNRLFSYPVPADALGEHGGRRQDEAGRRAAPRQARSPRRTGQEHVVQGQGVVRL